MKTYTSLIGRSLFVFLMLQAGLNALGQNKTPKPGKAGDISVSIQVLEKDSVRITVKNTGKRTLAAYSHVICRENQYDYLEIEGITPDQKKLLFSFYDDRPTYAPVLALLKPNEDFSCTISLADWSERLINKAMLKKAGIASLPHGMQIRAKFTISEADSFNGFIWSGVAYSDWVKF